MKDLTIESLKYCSILSSIEEYASSFISQRFSNNSSMLFNSSSFFSSSSEEIKDFNEDDFELEITDNASLVTGESVCSDSSMNFVFAYRIIFFFICSNFLSGKTLGVFSFSNLVFLGVIILNWGPNPNTVILLCFYFKFTDFSDVCCF